MSRAALFVAWVCAAPAFAETIYFAGIPDLPVAPGLTASAGLLAIFSTGRGDLVVTAARGPAAPRSVERFYMESLSALGWAYEPAPRDQGLNFQRGRERLTLHIEPQDGGTYMSVRLLARPAPSNSD